MEKRNDAFRLLICYPTMKGATKMRAMHIIVTMIFVMIVSGCDVGRAQTPGKRVLEAMELIRDGKPKELEDYVLKKDVPGAGLFYGLLSPAFTEKGGVTKIEVESEKIDGESASVKVRWHYKNGGSAHETFPLKREDGKWRIRL